MSEPNDGVTHYYTAKGPEGIEATYSLAPGTYTLDPLTLEITRRPDDASAPLK